MNTRRTISAGRTVTGWMLSATLATAGLGLAVPAALALADEAAPEQAAVQADPAVGQDAAAEGEAPVEAAQPQVQAAEQTTKVDVAVTNEATQAQAMLDKLNEARAAAGLPELAQSATLTQTAWQRAAESVVAPFALRPDGSALPYAEALLAGSAEQAGTADVASAALGANEAVLSPTATAAGVALVKDAAGAYHWAVELADVAPEQDATAQPSAVADGAATYVVTMPVANVTLDATTQSVQVAVGATVTLAPKVTVSGALSLTDGTASSYAFDATQAVSLDASQAEGWTSADTTAATVAAGVVTGVADGSSQVSATALGQQAAWNVTVGTGTAAATPTTPSTPEQGATTPDATDESASSETDAGSSSADVGATPTTPEQGVTTGDAAQSAASSADESTSSQAKTELSECTVMGITEATLGEGGKAEPAFTLADADGNLIDASQYEAAFSDNDKAGTGKLTITPAAGSSLTGELVYTFPITDGTSTLEAISLAGATLAIDGEDVELPSDGTSSEAGEAAKAYTAHVTIADRAYTGQEVKPQVKLSYGDKTLVEGTDYAVTYADNTGSADEDTAATLTITGQGTYVGTIEASFVITKPAPKDFADLGAKIEDIPAQSYTGTPVEPDVVVKTSDGAVLTRGEAYDVSYANNTGVGTGTVTVVGKGSYTGTLTKDFTIAANMEDAEVSGLDNQFYDGSAKTPAPKVTFGGTTLVEGTDYEVAYANNVNAGTATLTLTGKGAYAGTKTVEFPISAKSIKGATVSSIADQAFTGFAVTPQVSVKDGDAELAEGMDYTLSYDANVNAGTARVVVTGTGNYKGTLDATFKINQASMSQVEVIMPNQFATGSAITPKPVSVKLGEYTLTEGVDFDITGYGNNTAVGKAYATLTGKGNFTGAVNAAFEIKSAQDAASDAGNTQTLPKTGDATSVVPVVVAGVAGVALVGAGVGLALSRRRARKDQ